MVCGNGGNAVQMVMQEDGNALPLRGIGGNTKKKVMLRHLVKPVFPLKKCSFRGKTHIILLLISLGNYGQLVA